MLAFSARNDLTSEMAGEARVSPVFFLNANPRTAIFLLVMVLNSYKTRKPELIVVQAVDYAHC